MAGWRWRWWGSCLVPVPAGMEPPPTATVLGARGVTVYKVLAGGDATLAAYNDGCITANGAANNWQALYTQFQRDHVLGTVPYRWEQEGVREARLVAITFDELDIVVLDGPLMHHGSISGGAKAAAAKEALGIAASAPLMAALGERRQVALVRETEKEWELVVPHALVSHLRYSERSVARFQRHPRMPITHLWCAEGDGNWRRWSEEAVAPDCVPDLATPQPDTQSGGGGAAAPASGALMELPEELRLRVLGCCSPRGLLRMARTCRVMRDLLAHSEKGEQLWRELLHEVWLRNPRCQFGARRWWLCAAARSLESPTDRSGDDAVELALPWRVCGNSLHCQLVRQLSFRESYKACLQDRERSKITAEELIALKWSVDFSGMAGYLPLADNLRAANPIELPDIGEDGEGEGGGGVPATFHRDGCYEDSVMYTRGSRPCRWVQQSILRGMVSEDHPAVDKVVLLPTEGARMIQVQRMLLDRTSWAQAEAASAETEDGAGALDLDYMAAQLQQHSCTWSLTEEPAGMITLRSNRFHSERIPCLAINTHTATDPKVL